MAPPFAAAPATSCTGAALLRPMPARLPNLNLAFLNVDNRIPADPPIALTPCAVTVFYLLRSSSPAPPPAAPTALRDPVASARVRSAAQELQVSRPKRHLYSPPSQSSAFVCPFPSPTPIAVSGPLVFSAVIREHATWRAQNRNPCNRNHTHPTHVLRERTHIRLPATSGQTLDHKSRSHLIHVVSAHTRVCRAGLARCHSLHTIW